MNKTRVAVVFGGRSSEHAVSCMSAGSVIAAIDPSAYDVVTIGITPEGRWVRTPGAVESVTPESGSPVALPGEPGGSLADVDVVFPVLHGPYGEDGTIQGLLEMAGIPYVGSGVLASALCMDKEFMKLALAARGLPVERYTVVTEAQWQASRADCLARIDALGRPVFVKPARGGSSIGISKVPDGDDVAAAVEVAREYDGKVIVEAAVVGREIECGVLGTLGGGLPAASRPAEVRVAGDFYDFQAKYVEDATQFDVPADLSDDDTAAVQRRAVEAFEALGCAGLARVDFFLTDNGPVLNEVNTMPGFTPMSMFPRMWAASGLAYPALVDRLIKLALESGTGLR